MESEIKILKKRRFFCTQEEEKQGVYFTNANTNSAKAQEPYYNDSEGFHSENF